MKKCFYAAFCLAGLTTNFQTAFTQPADLKQILSNGPTEKRLNIVFLSEGYTQSQLLQFENDATTSLGQLFSTLPLSTYSHYFNAFLIGATSQESGSDHPSRGIYRNTFFNSTYDSFGIARLVTIDQAGHRRVDSLLILLMPEYDIVLMIVNDPEYGGSGGFPVIASVHQSFGEILVHELGHSFAGLADEYSDPYPGSTPREFPNVTQQTQRTSIKWRPWILDTTPIPTPPISAYSALIGLFEGAIYQSTGWYRPKLNCLMRSLGVPFCEVCVETWVKAIYGSVRPIEAYSPTISLVSIADTQSVQFAIVPMHPSFHNLAVQWFVNSALSANATLPFFNVSGRDLGIGNHTVQASVYDTTALVRNDIPGLLRDFVSWTVQVSATTSVERLNSEVPATYHLAQNYPNPFNPVTTIQFSLPKESPVVLTIFNSLGMEIEVLVNQSLPPGHYRVQWTPRNISTGVYFCQLKSTEFTNSKKLLFVK